MFYNKYMSFNDFQFEMKESKTDYTCLKESSGEIQEKKVDYKYGIIITGRFFLIALLFFYYCFSIKALIEMNYIKERHICKVSDLWSYLFSSLFANFIMIKIRTKINENKLLVILLPNIYIGFIKTGYVIWGSLLFYGIPCLDKLSSSLLFKMALFQYIFDIISLALTFIISLHLINLVYEDNKKTKEAAIDALANAMGESNLNSMDI